jgi:hypothetical protein
MRHGPIAAVALVGLALAVRLPGLFGWWLNPDEGTYFAVLTQESFSAFRAEAFATAHPPLYFLILRGMGLIGTDFAWLRSLALVSGCAAVYVFVLVGREIAGGGARGWLTGLAAGLLLALSPGAVALSQVIRPYMLLVLLLAFTLYVLLRYFREPSGALLVLYAVSASLAALLHYSAALGLGVIGVLVLADGIARGWERPEWHRLLAMQLFPGAIVGILYVSQLRQLMDSPVAEFALTGWLSGYLIHTPSDVWLSLVGFHSALVGDWAAVSATSVSLIGLAYAARRREWTLLLAVASGLLVATICASLQLYPFGAGRHSAWLLPFVTPGLAWLLQLLVTSGRRAPAFAALTVGAIVAGTMLRALLGGDLTEPAAREHVLRQEHVDAMAGVLDPQGAPRVVVMSLETYRLLVPVFALDRQRAQLSPDRLVAHFRWGTRDVIVLPGLDIAVGPSQLDQPNHLYTATRRAAAGFGVALPENGEPVLVLSGGWHVEGIFELAEISHQVGLPGTAESVPGLIALTLDLEAYGRALAEISR